MQEFLVLPGYNGSGPQHWQTLWEAAHPGFRRVQQRDWDNPVQREWSETLERAIAEAAGQVVLVAHSLACLLVVHWAAMAAPATLSKVKAALFVAPVNPGSAVFPKQAIGFTPVPKTQLPFRSLVVASTNDPYGSVEYGLECSQSWGSRFEVIGPKGHINGASGLGSWEEGFQLLTGLVRG
jgi:uncharacterized protein